MDFDEATKELIDADGSRYTRLNLDQEGTLTDSTGRRYGRFDWVDEGHHAEGDFVLTPTLIPDAGYEDCLRLAQSKSTGKFSVLLRSAS